MNLRLQFQKLAGYLLATFGVRGNEVSLYTDVWLAFPLVFLAFFAEIPLFSIIAGSVPSAREWLVSVAAVGLAGALSYLAHRWTAVLCAAFAFLAVRCAIGLILVDHNPGIVALGLVNAALALLLFRKGESQLGGPH